MRALLLSWIFLIPFIRGDCNACSSSICAADEVLCDACVAPACTAVITDDDCDECFDGVGCEERVYTPGGLACGDYCVLNGGTCILLSTLDCTSCNDDASTTDCERNCENRGCAYDDTDDCSCTCDCQADVDECQTKCDSPSDHICEDDSDGGCHCVLECSPSGNAGACNEGCTGQICIPNEDDTACECADCAAEACGSCESYEVCGSNDGEACTCVECPLDTECDSCAPTEICLPDDANACVCSECPVDECSGCTDPGDEMCLPSGNVCTCTLECNTDINDDACEGNCDGTCAPDGGGACECVQCECVGCTEDEICVEEQLDCSCVLECNRDINETACNDCEYSEACRPNAEDDACECVGCPTDDECDSCTAPDDQVCIPGDAETCGCTVECDLELNPGACDGLPCAGDPGDQICSEVASACTCLAECDITQNEHACAGEACNELGDMHCVGDGAAGCHCVLECNSSINEGACGGCGPSELCVLNESEDACQCRPCTDDECEDCVGDELCAPMGEICGCLLECDRSINENACEGCTGVCVSDGTACQCDDCPLDNECVTCSMPGDQMCIPGDGETCSCQVVCDVSENPAACDALPCAEGEGDQMCVPVGGPGPSESCECALTCDETINTHACEGGCGSAECVEGHWDTCVCKTLVDCTAADGCKPSCPDDHECTSDSEYGGCECRALDCNVATACDCDPEAADNWCVPIEHECRCSTKPPCTCDCPEPEDLFDCIETEWGGCMCFKDCTGSDSCDDCTGVCQTHPTGLYCACIHDSTSTEGITSRAASVASSLWAVIFISLFLLSNFN